MNFKKIITSIFFIILFFSFYKGADAAMIQRAPNNLGIVGYWSFNDGAGTKATDSSGNSNTGVFNGAPAWTSGRLGKALSFDGGDDYIQTSSTAIKDNSNITISFWFKSNTNSQTAHMIWEGDSTANGWSSASNEDEFHITIGWNDGSLHTGGIEAMIVDTNNNYSGVSRDTTFSDTTNWHHALVTITSSRYVELFLDGVSKGVGDAGYTITRVYDTAMRIARPGASTRYFNGKIDEVRIYNRALTAAEVTALYRTGLSVINSSAQNNKITNGLVGLWSFNGSDMDWSQSTAEALDRSSNSNNGDVIGPTSVEGVSGQALSFDGSNDYINLADNDSLDLRTHDLTAIAWIKTTMTTTGRVISKKIDQDSPYLGWLLEVDGANNRMKGGFRWSGSAAAYPTGTIDITDGNWHQVVLKIIFGGNVQLYVDGMADGSPVSSSGALDVNPAIAATIGRDCDSSNSFFNGTIDEVRVYNRALTTTEITDLYKMGATRLQTNTSQVNKYKDGSLVFLQTFNGPDMDWSQSSAEARDRSGQNNNGDVIGATAVEGVSGQALSFDGVNDYVNGIARATSVLINWTISAWINPRVLPQGPSDTGIAVYNGNDAGGYGFGVGDAGASGSKLMGLYGQVVWIDSGYTFPNIDQWYHIVMVRGTRTVYFYVNGVQTPNTSSATPLTVPNYLTIGNQLDSSLNLYRYFNGKIDEVRIYSRALSVAEILKLYRGGK